MTNPDESIHIACPWCGEHWGGGEVLEGDPKRCENCGKPIVWCGGARMERIERDPADPRTGHQKARARKQRRGWR